MKNPDNGAERDLLLVGGGHSHALILRMLAMKPIAGVRLTLISPDSLTAYSGMLPGLVAGHYSLEDTHIDLRRLCQTCGCRFVRASVTALDPTRHRVTLDDGTTLDYDWMSLDVGAIPDAPHGGPSSLIPVKPVASFYQRWQQLLKDMSARPGPSRLAVVGGGAGGTEMVLAMATALAHRQQEAQLSLYTGAGLLPGYPARARRHMAAHLQRHRVSLHEGVRVTTDEQGQLRADGQPVPTDFVLWCTGVRGLPWLAASGLPCDERGFLRVHDTLQSVGDEHIFAAGDCAAFPAPLPKAGVFAVRQAATLAANLRAAIGGRPLRRYRPQRRFLSLLSAGDKVAVASRGTALVANGGWVWRWKDRIDRAFMDKFHRQLPRMAMPAPSATAAPATMHCAGCGAKVGSEALSEALADLQPQINEGIEAGVAQAEDAAVIRWPAGQTLVQSLDYFPAFIDEPHLFGRLAVLHSLSDLYAMNASPHSALANVCLPWLHPRLQRRDLQRLMAGAVFELNRAGCTLVGGHTIEGPQLAAGFTVNGRAADGTLWQKTGARPGDVLILTKPLGTGIQLASLMHGLARGPWLDATLDSMLQSNALARDALIPFQPSACTDVTGFGLFGHLHEICQQSGVIAELNLQDLPLLPGTEALLAKGVRSTLHPANAALLTHYDYPGTDDTPTLLAGCDPQTCGGLLAALAAEQADQALQVLAQKGVFAKKVGKVVVKNRPDSPILLR
ncbi:hypothetical protein A11A3_01902 [Alcanivorax hongdengensis A-11-3]|uniref:Selenide, water dikinase n=1 Tax=Alcanivorax hongdengensis A-11-3 TaxID=1177179 RepID=L0WIB6_9GAMM|nr:selenide, water dikinase SelD [Alcanivorax hongdengensis]EKF75585.1 hypothetical protein A11A3_01902 [Alcanivorax hongdengensis A-11-3]